MKKIHIRFMKDTLNIEFGELFNIISNRVAAAEVDISSLSTVTERLKFHQKELLKMNYKKLRHPLTQPIQKQVTTRTEYLACLRLTVEAKMLSNKPEERIAAERLLLWLRAYKNEIYAPTIHTQSRMMKNLMDDRLENEEIQQATALLNLDDLLEAILEIDALINHNFLKRLNEKDNYEVNGKAIREAAYDDLKVLLIVLELNCNTSVEDVQREQVAELSMYINEELKIYRAKLRSRNTKKKNKKSVQIAVNDLIGDPLEERAKENLPSVIYNQWGPSSGSAGEKLLKDFRISNTKDKEKGAKGGGNGKDLLPPN